MQFKTKKECINYLESLTSAGLLEQLKDIYTTAGRYILSHGEYDRPDYKPQRYGKCWKIKAIFYYYAGTLNAPVDQPVDMYIVKDDWATRLDIYPQD